MRKLKRILAWIGIIVLVSLYVVTFVLGLTGSPATKNLLMASIVCTVIVPVLFYAMMLLAKTMSWHLPGDSGVKDDAHKGKPDAGTADEPSKENAVK